MNKLNKKKDWSLGGAIAFIGLAYGFVGLLLTGWVFNILALVDHAESMSVGYLIVRSLGILIVPLGGIMGYVGV